MNKPNIVSKFISIFSVILLVLNIIFSAYIVSFSKNQIDSNNFTISQSLAFGNNIAIVVLIVISLLLFGYLIYYRKQSNIITLLGLFLLFVAGVFLITIVWITTFRNEQQHYIFALISFICAILFITLNSYSLWTEKQDKNFYEKIIILLIPILTYISFIGLGIGFFLSNKNIAHEVFPSFENIIVTLLGGSILSLGFI